MPLNLCDVSFLQQSRSQKGCPLGENKNVLDDDYVDVEMHRNYYEQPTL